MDQIIAIAQLFIDNKSIGFRLLDINNKIVKDVPIKSIVNVLTRKNIQIDNLELQNGRIVGSNGSIDRLPKVINGLSIGKSPLVVLNKIDSIGYTVSDFKGEILKVQTTELIQYARAYGIANGKLVRDKAVGYKIVPIKGEYKLIPSTKTTNEEWEDAFSKAQILFNDIALRVKDILIVRSEGYLALAKLKGGLITPYKYAAINSITSRTAVVTSGKHMGVVSTITGKEIIPPKYMMIQRFDNNSNLFIVSEGVAKCSLYDYTGKMVTENYDNILPLYSSGYAKATKIIHKQENTCILNELGQEVGCYESFNRLINDYALVKFFEEPGATTENNRLGIISNKGRLITKDRYSHILMLDNDGAVKLGKDINNDRFYTITTLQDIKKGKTINVPYSYIGRFYDNVAICMLGNKYGLLDTKGNILKEPIYDTITRLGPRRYELTKDNKKNI